MGVRGEGSGWEVRMDGRIEVFVEIKKNGGSGSGGGGGHVWGGGGVRVNVTEN